MWKLHVFVVLSLLLVGRTSSASYSGPFLFWGIENLSNLRTPALQAIDDQVLRGIFTQASSVIVFIRHSRSKLNYENFPRLSEIMKTNDWLYLPQETLSSDPLEFNATVFVLNDPVEQQDNEIAVLYHKAQVNSGNKNVLGILATCKSDHLVSKREAESYKVTDTESVENILYIAKGVAMFRTVKPPVLYIAGSSYKLTHVVDVSAYEHKTFSHLTVKFVNPHVKTDRIFIKFIFQNETNGYWNMKEVEVEFERKKTTLASVGDYPEAPLRFSYICNEVFVFMNDSVVLQLETIQAQPFLVSKQIEFGRANDCTGFFTTPILAGILISAICGYALYIGIKAILNIRPNDRFENRHARPFVFNIQEHLTLN